MWLLKLIDHITVAAPNSLKAFFNEASTVLLSFCLLKRNIEEGTCLLFNGAGACKASVWSEMDFDSHVKIEGEPHTK